MNRLTVVYRLGGSLSIALVLSLLFVGVLAALTLGYADGVWSNAVSFGGGAVECLRFGADNSSSTNQGDSLTDENQVRYGRSGFSTSCGSTTFPNQSGFGFDGTNGPLVFNPGDLFLLGQFTHYNQVIYLSDQDDRLKFVDLAVTLNFTDPLLNTTLDFTMELDETPNDPDDNPGDVCPYGDSTDDTNDNCDDKVTFPAGIPDQTFDIDGKTYTLQIVGFVQGTTATCDANDSPTDNFITGENQQNDACLFGRILEVTYDFGDAPDGTNSYPNQTLLPNGGRHIVNPDGPYLGVVPPESDIDGAPSLHADGDDLDTGDDEDGFDYIFPDDMFGDGDGGSIEVTVSGIPQFDSACVYGWIDWDLDGFSNDGVTDSVSSLTVTSNGPATMVFDSGLPASGQYPTQTYLRLRLVSGECAAQPISPTGLQTGGEIEDYELTFTPTALELQNFEAAEAVNWSMATLILTCLLLFVCTLAWRRRSAGQLNKPTISVMDE